MSIDTVNIKGNYKDPTNKISLYDFDIQNPESLPFGRRSCRKKSSTEKKEHFPTINIIKNYHNELDLSLEFSVGKFLHNNNIESIQKSTFSHFIKKLINELNSKSIYLSGNYLKNNTLSRYDACMVLDLSKYSSCMTVMQTLAKIAYPKNTKQKKRRYPDPEFDGFQFVLTNRGKPEWKLVIYDKLAEVLASKENREEEVLLETNGELIKTTVKEALESMNIKQLLRIELQLLTPRAIKDQAKRIGLDTDNLTFETLFDQQIACNMILDVWDRYITPHLTSGLLYRANKFSIVDKALKQGKSYREIALMFGYKLLGEMYQHGINDIKQMQPDKNLRPWIIETEKIYDDIKNSDNITIGKTFKYIRKCIKEVIPFKFKV